MLEVIENNLFLFVCKFNEYLSNYILVVMLISVGVWYTIKTRFVQIRCFTEGFRNMFGKNNPSDNGKEDSMTSFQAFSTAIASQVGTGNIVGASGAILIGGPGAIFWMWVIAFWGMATIYAEASLAIQTRIIDKKGNISGGPAYYIRKSYNKNIGKFLATFFVIIAIPTLGFMDCMVQSNSIAFTLNTALNIPNWVIGILLVMACSPIFFGSVKRFASVVEKMVPIMAIFFIIGGLIILILRIKYIPETFYLIFKYAFQPQAILGGGFWYAFKTAISQGAKRGLFSNEAGMGSTPHAHALAKNKTPHEQGTVAMIGVFIDTFIILTLNALVIISTLYTSGGMLQDGYTGTVMTILDKTNLAQVAFGSLFGHSFGSIFVAICLFFFAFSSIISWNLFGKINVIYLFKKQKRVATFIYAILALFFALLGTLISSDFVWELADMFYNLMVIPNALALFALTNLVVSATK